MKRYKDSMPITSIIRRERKIDPKPEYQRGPVWSTKQKQLLIDTILRDLDIPKFYLRELNDGEFDFEVVDGQQRLRTIWEFRKGKYRIAKDSDPIDGDEVANLYYNELSEDLKDTFDSYSLDIIILKDSTLDEVEEMFVRLQNGSTLKAAEKRNALPGDMKYFIRDLAKHKFFEVCGFENQRFQFDHVAAQCMLSEMNGGPCNVKNADLEKMYLSYQEFDKDSDESKKVNKVFNFLRRIFSDRTPELKRFNVISLYLLISMLREKYAISDLSEKINKWFINFEKNRMEELNKPEEQRNPELIAYHNATSHSTDALESLEYRHKILSREFFIAFPDVAPLDETRGFSYEQKLAIFRRDNGICQLKDKCSGERMGWDDDWHIDHKIPYSKGGKTTVANGQLSCASCNLAKGSDMDIL